MAGELLLATLTHVWAALAGLKLDMALMGGIAVAAWHRLRTAGQFRADAGSVGHAAGEVLRYHGTAPFLTI